VASELLRENPDLSLVVKHFPFCSACNEHAARTIHPNACWAARAAETAALLGGTEGFERMHAWLFERKGSFTDATFPDDLRALGFDPAEFISMMTSQETLELVRGDTDDARALGVYFTPMIFVNGHEHTWYYGDETSLGQAVVAARGGRSAIPASIEEKLVADWSGRPMRPAPPADGRRMLGDGRVEIVVFGEYGTEPTRQLDAAVRSMIDAGRPVRYLFRHYPIDDGCNELAERFGTQNTGACLDARIVEATELVVGHEARWSLHSKLMLPSTKGSDRKELLLELGLPAREILAAAGSDPRVRERVRGDIDEKVRIWRMHAPILMVDRRFVPRWQHDDVSPERLLELVLDTLPNSPTKDDA
jgi:protein-disulfide isomerase